MSDINIKYPAVLTLTNAETITIAFRDLPQIIVTGKSQTEAQQAAKEALFAAINFYMEEKQAVPTPSTAQADDLLFTLPVQLATKILLWNEVLKQRNRSNELIKPYDAL